jgi:YD repeat-containing protein
MIAVVRGDRVVADTAPDGQVESRVYDRAGNVTGIQTRRGSAITMAYDAANRLTTRNVPGVTYDTILAGIAARDNDPYPRQPNSGRMYAVPADTESFAYDREGRITSANNKDARVAREYFANGLLKNETLEIRNARDTTFGHSYTSRYSYDLNGRRTAVGLPTQLVPAGTRDSIGYQYNATTGELQRVTDALGNEFAYGYTLRGEPSSLSFPNSYVQRWSYFPDGSLRTDSVRNVGTLSGSRLPSVARATAFTYDARGNLLNSADATGFRDTVTATYSGLGYVLSNRMRQDGQLQGVPITDRYVTVEQQTYDALGNMATAATADTSFFNNVAQQKNWRPRTLTYASGVGRLTAETGGSAKTYRYDAEGNTVFSTKAPSGGQASPNSDEDRATYYAADGRVRAADYRFIRNGLVDESPRDWVFEEYRYDALGRRVWVRAYRSCAFYAPKTSNPKFLECHTSTLRRTVWDQERELIEIQVPGDSAQSNAVLENDTAVTRLPRDSANNDPSPHFGRVLYVHGLALDRPIAITRYNYVDFAFGQPYTDS